MDNDKVKSRKHSKKSDRADSKTPKGSKSSTTGKGEGSPKRLKK
jgi:hypothetical protein